MERRQPVHPFSSVTDGQHTHEKIATQIRSAILEKKVQRGERLPSERELALIFNTSRVSVRSALLTLRNAGLLQIKPGKAGGAFIADDIGEAELAQILRDIIEWKSISISHVIEVRAIIEPQIAYLAAKNAGDDDIEGIWATISELEQLFETKTKFEGSDENFHRALAKAARNPLLAVFQGSLIDILFGFIYRVIWQEEQKESIMRHHRKIAEKVERRTPEAARRAMVEHLADMQLILSKLPETEVLRWTRK